MSSHQEGNYELRTQGGAATARDGRQAGRSPARVRPASGGAATNHQRSVQYDMAPLQDALDSHYQAQNIRQRSRNEVMSTMVKRKEVREMKERYLATLRERPDVRAAALKPREMSPRNKLKQQTAPVVPRARGQQSCGSTAATTANMFLPGIQDDDSPLTHNKSKKVSLVTDDAFAPTPPRSGKVQATSGGRSALKSSADKHTVNSDIPRCRVGHDTKNSDASILIHEHLINIRTMNETNTQRGFAGVDSFVALDSCFSDLDRCTAGELRDLLQEVKQLLDTVSLLPSSSTGLAVAGTGDDATTVNKAVSSSAHGHWPQRKPYMVAVKQLEKELEELSLHHEKADLQLRKFQIEHESILNSNYGGGGSSAAKRRLLQKEEQQSQAQNNSGLTENLIAENRQLRTDLRATRRELRDTKAEVLYYRHQSEELQTNLTSAFNKLYEQNTRQKDGSHKPVDPQSAAHLVHQSNSGIAQVLALPFAGPQLEDDVAPDVDDTKILSTSVQTPLSPAMTTSPAQPTL